MNGSKEHVLFKSSGLTLNEYNVYLDNGLTETL